MLVGEAEYWWDGTRRLLEGGRIIITWDVFRTKFLEKYFPNDVRRAKEIEFMQLKQGSMTVGKYASKFEKLGKYSTFFYHPEEKMNCIKFENGLRDEYRKAVGILEIADIPTLIHKCRFLEDFENNQNIKPKYFRPQTNKNKHFEGFSKIAMPLTQLTKNGQSFVWTEKCENSFQELKRRLTTSLVLALPDSTGQFVIFCDASKMGLSCVLMQDRMVVAYASRQLRTHEKITQPRIWN